MTDTKEIEEQYGQLMAPFLQAAEEALTMMAGVSEFKVKRIFCEDCGDLSREVSGVVGLSGGFRGTVVTSFDMTSASRVVSQLLEQEPGSLSESDIQDGIAEIVNMIAGGAKTRMANIADKFSISVPTVVTGKGHAIGNGRVVVSVYAQVEIDDDGFVLQLCLPPKAEN